jgi:hypothetical protein
MLVKFFFIISGIICFSQALQAQSTISSTGNTLKSSDKILEYSVGQIAIETLQSSTNKITQGILQPSIKVSVFVNEKFEEKYWLKVFPNPGNGIINISTNYHLFQSFNITDIQGRLISDRPFIDGKIDISKFANGTYLVQLISKEYFKTIQIIKQ